MFLHVSYLFRVYVSFPIFYSWFIFFFILLIVLHTKDASTIVAKLFQYFNLKLFSFKQEQNLLELFPYPTPIIQMMIKYISSFVNHLKKAVLLIRQSFLELEEFVRQDIFILPRHVYMYMNN